jgi:signal transduction histidine kinase
VFERLRHLGLQRRIMLFVVAGLSLMFGTLAVLGLGTIDQATQLVYRERLSTAYTTAAILDGDLAQVAADAREEGEELSLASVTSVPSGSAAVLLERLEESEQYPFFHVAGVWIVDPSGAPLAVAGSPAATSTSVAAAVSLSGQVRDGVAVGLPVGTIPDGVAFASIAVALGSAEAPRALVHLASINATIDYVPGAAALGAGDRGGTDPTANHYHLEVLDPEGVAVLGIGSDERPGEPSYHYPRIRTLMAAGAAAALLHEPGPGESVEPHIMAVVPLASTPLYVVLEQPSDVALALPHDLRDRLFVTIGLGFVAALAVAWVTTRHVVKPTERLTAAAGRIAGGDLATPIDVAAEDEIGRLAESLEVMRQQLQAARQASDELQAELERRVEDRTARLNLLLGQTIDAQEAERLRLARELHDETAQSLAALAINLDRARDQLDDNATGVRDHIAGARATAAHLLADTRRLIMGLRPAALDDLGLVPAIRSYAETTLESRGIAVTIEAANLPRLGSHIEVAVFRILQEALTNVARHARADTARVVLAADSEVLVVAVEDNGIGFDVDRGLGRSSGGDASFGLLGMQERVRLLGGEIAISSGPNSGTRIVIRIPLGPEPG